MDLRTLADRDDWTCWICGGGIDLGAPRGSPRAPSVDHVVPRARGGGNEPANLRLAPAPLNVAVGDACVADRDVKRRGAPRPD